MMMFMMMQQFMGMPGANPNNQSPDSQWKMKLHEACQRSGVTEKLEYTTEAAGENINGGWNCTVTIKGESFTSESPAPSKKAAEQGVAKIALEKLFPDEFQKAMSNPLIALGAMAKGGGGKGQKRKREEVELPPKNKLNQGVQLLVQTKLGRMLSKGEMVYEMQELGDGPVKTYQATVKLPEIDGNRSEFTGEVCESKKKAEDSAAVAAYDGLKEMIEPIAEEKAAAKKAKNQEELKALVARTAEKKAAKKAAAEAAGTKPIEN